MDKEQKAQAQQIANKLSEEALLTQLMEECGELVQVLAKRVRILRGENYTPISDAENFESLTEEAADVVLCLGVLNSKLGFNKQKFDEITNKKLKRWVTRLKLK